MVNGRQCGWVRGANATATSTAFVTGNQSSPVIIDYMYIKIVLTRTNGTTTESETGNTNATKYVTKTL